MSLTSYSYLLPIIQLLWWTEKKGAPTRPPGKGNHVGPAADVKDEFLFKVRMPQEAIMPFSIEFKNTGCLCDLLWVV